MTLQITTAAEQAGIGGFIRDTSIGVTYRVTAIESAIPSREVSCSGGCSEHDSYCDAEEMETGDPVTVVAMVAVDDDGNDDGEETRYVLDSEPEQATDGEYMEIDSDEYDETDSSYDYVVTSIDVTGDDDNDDDDTETDVFYPAAIAAALTGINGIMRDVSGAHYWLTGYSAADRIVEICSNGGSPFRTTARMAPVHRADGSRFALEIVTGLELAEAMRVAGPGGVVASQSFYVVSDSTGLYRDGVDYVGTNGLSTYPWRVLRHQVAEETEAAAPATRPELPVHGMRLPEACELAGNGGAVTRSGTRYTVQVVDGVTSIMDGYGDGSGDGLGRWIQDGWTVTAYGPAAAIAEPEPVADSPAGLTLAEAVAAAGMHGVVEHASAGKWRVGLPVNDLPIVLTVRTGYRHYQRDHEHHSAEWTVVSTGDSLEFPFGPLFMADAIAAVGAGGTVSDGPTAWVVSEDLDHDVTCENYRDVELTRASDGRKLTARDLGSDGWTAVEPGRSPEVRALLAELKAKHTLALADQQQAYLSQIERVRTEQTAEVQRLRLEAVGARDSVAAAERKLADTLEMWMPGGIVNKVACMRGDLTSQCSELDRTLRGIGFYDRDGRNRNGEYLPEASASGRDWYKAFWITPVVVDVELPNNAGTLSNSRVEMRTAAGDARRAAEHAADTYAIAIELGKKLGGLEVRPEHIRNVRVLRDSTAPAPGSYDLSKLTD